MQPHRNIILALLRNATTPLHYSLFTPKGCLPCKGGGNGTAVDEGVGILAPPYVGEGLRTLPTVEPTIKSKTITPTYTPDGKTPHQGFDHGLDRAKIFAVRM